MFAPRILAFSGSARTESLNTKLLRIGVAGARDAGAEVSVINLRDFNLPIYDGDLESASGLPQAVHELREIFLSHRGLLIACPEYNGSFTPLLKNTLDWVSRPVAGHPPLDCYRDKIAAVCSASPGWRGGLRGLAHLRDLLGNVGVLTLTTEVTIPDATKAFGSDNLLLDPKRQQSATRLGAELTFYLKKIS